VGCCVVLSVFTAEEQLQPEQWWLRGQRQHNTSKSPCSQDGSCVTLTSRQRMCDPYTQATRMCNPCNQAGDICSPYRQAMNLPTLSEGATGPVVRDNTADCISGHGSFVAGERGRGAYRERGRLARGRDQARRWDERLKAQLRECMRAMLRLCACMQA